MRGLSFYAHAVGTAAFPGLVLADGLGFSAPLGAFAAALVFAFGVERLARRPRAGYDSLTALVLVAALAGGVVLASDVFHSGGDVDSLLFGSLLLTGTRDLVLAGAASAAAIAATLDARAALARARVRSRGGARHGPALARGPTRVLLVLVAFAVVASLTAIGALLATALFVVPAATVRLWTQRLAVWQLGIGRARGGPGDRRAVALGRAEHAARADGRRARRRALRALAAARAPRDGRAGPCARWRGPRCCSRSPSPPAASSSHGGSGPDVVATTTQIGDWTRAVGGDAARRASDPAAQHRSARVRAAPGGCGGRRRARSSSSSTAIVSTPGWAPCSRTRAARRRSSISGRRCRCACAGESDGPEASRYDPHWWHDPRNAEAAVRSDPRRARRRRSRGRRAPTAPTPRPTWAACARSTRASARASRACRRRSASSSPTTTRSATSRTATASRSSGP